MTLFDLFIVIIIALSAVFAWVRGFVREVVTLVAIGLGVWADLLFGASVAGLLGDGAISLVLGYSLLFLVVFVAASIGLELLIGRFLGKDPAAWDQIAGAIYGAVRGWLLLGLVYLALNIYFEETERPDWVQNAALRAPIAAAAGLFERLGLEPVHTDQGTANDESSETAPV